MLLFGHRGASADFPENSLIAFEKAYRLGCDGVELDVQQSADGAIVVFHDWLLDRCSNGRGLLRTKTSRELYQLDNGSWFASRFAQSRIPSLQEVLDLVPAAKLINIEIKELYSEERGTPEKIAALIEQTKGRDTDNIIISSFSHNLLARLHLLNPRLKIGLLISSTLINLPQYIAQLSFPIYSFHQDLALLNAEETHWVKSQGIQVYPWTVNTASDLEHCRQLGVDGVMSNHVDILKGQ